MKKYIIAFNLLVSVLVFSQSEPKLSIFSYNPLQYNPAYAGAFDGLSVTGIYSSQWVGFDGAPKTLFFSAHSNVIEREIGVGVNFTSDKAGPVQDNQIVGNFAYNIFLNDELSLNLGLKAGLDNYNLDYRLLTIENPQEAGIFEGTLNQYSPIVGAGFYLCNEKAYVGISVPNLLKTNYITGSQISIANTKPNYFLTAGYKFDLQNEVYLIPNILTRVTAGAPIANLISLNLDYQKSIKIGMNVQPTSSFGGFFGYRFENNLSIGYAYDSAINNFSTASGGCHTFYLNFRIDELLSNHYGFGTF
jgi:type IX secretion system PorP/SprF family membrane protein